MKLTWEAAEINRAKKFEKACSMLWILLEVLIDHVQSWLEHGVQSCWNLWSEEVLKQHISPGGVWMLMLSTRSDAPQVGW